MALFKAFSGERSRLDSVAIVEGHAHFCTDDGTFHIDYKDVDGTLKRKPVNDSYIKQLVTLQEFVEGMSVNIPDAYLNKEDFTWDNLKNKPFSEELIEYTPIWEGEAVFEAERDDIALFSISGLNLDSSKSYILTADNVVQGEFVCTSIDPDTYTETYTNITNTNYNEYLTLIREAADHDTADLTFVVTIYKYGMPSGPHHIKIEEKSKSIITPIADKFIPDTIARRADILDYTVTCEDTDYEATSDSAAFKRHIIKQFDKTICKIDVPVDLVVKSGSVKEVTIVDEPYVGANVGDKYIELVVANQDTPIYVPAKDLVDIYTAEANATVVQLSINGSNVISANIIDKSITEAKLSEELTDKLAQISTNTTAIANRYTKEETNNAITDAINAWWASIPDGEELEV